jgi:arabinogalactan oligomer/maltooligosaccharide transport system permease protein
MRRLGLPGQLSRQLFLLVVGLFTLLPVWVLVLMATDGSLLGYPDGFHPFPVKPTLDLLIKTVTENPHEHGFTGLLFNSLFVSGASAITAMILGASMAYGFARMRFPGRQVGLVAILLGAFLPPIALATPLFVLFVNAEKAIPALSDFGLRDSTLALAILYASFSMPLCVWLMRAAFRAVPADLEEAAFVDGATRFTAFRHITLPLAMPSILVAALVAFLLGYTEFALAWLFIDSPQNITLAMTMAEATTGVFTSDWAGTAANALWMTAPVVVIFLVLQRALLRSSLATTGTD